MCLDMTLLVFLVFYSWSLSPNANSWNSNNVFNVNSTGNVNDNNSMNAGSVRPVAFYLFGYYFLVNNMIIIEDNIYPRVLL